MIAYLLEIRHGGSFFSGPRTSTEVNYGAIPYQLTHPGKLCALAEVAGTHASTIACQGQPGVSGTPPPKPAPWETVFTSMFLHANFLHIAGNMVFLWIFGPAVEDSMGRPRFLAFYLIGGLIALGAQIAAAPDATGPTLGASGAIAAVLGGHLVLYPRAKVLSIVFIIFFVTIVELPGIVLLGFWFLEQLFLALEGLAGAVASGEGVAYFAHIGGFLFGLVTIRAFAHRRGGGRGLLSPA